MIAKWFGSAYFIFTSQVWILRVGARDCRCKHNPLVFWDYFFRGQVIWSGERQSGRSFGRTERLLILI